MWHYCDTCHNFERLLLNTPMYSIQKKIMMLNMTTEGFKEYVLLYVKVCSNSDALILQTKKCVFRHC